MDKVEMAITEYVFVGVFPACFANYVPQTGHCDRLFQPDGPVSRNASLTFSKLTNSYRSCHSKCISQRYIDGELNKGESVCIDRCVSKFNEVQKKVGEKLQARGAAAGGASSGLSM